MAHINTLEAFGMRNGAITGILQPVKPFLTATFLDIAVSRDFCILEAAIGKFKEALVGIKVVYGTYKHFRRVMTQIDIYEALVARNGVITGILQPFDRF